MLTPKNPTQQARLTAGPVASWLNTLLDLLYPPRCAGCGRVDTPWCETCQARMEAIPIETILHPAPEPLLTRAATGPHVRQLQRAVQALKYENARAVAHPLGERLSKRLSLLGWEIDFVTAVPLHPQRLRERGYNQAGLLAEALCAVHGLPYFPDALQRTLSTRSQVGLGRDARMTNVKGAFYADGVQCKNKAILIIDDVTTTGATLAECAQAALDADAATVYGLTVTVSAS